MASDDDQAETGDDISGEVGPDEAVPDDPTGGAEPLEPDDTAETRAMQGEIVAEGLNGGLIGLAAGAAVAGAATVWLKLRRRR